MVECFAVGELDDGPLRQIEYESRSAQPDTPQIVSTPDALSGDGIAHDIAQEEASTDSFAAAEQPGPRSADSSGMQLDPEPRWPRS